MLAKLGLLPVSLYLMCVSWVHIKIPQFSSFFSHFQLFTVSPNSTEFMQVRPLIYIYSNGSADLSKFLDVRMPAMDIHDIRIEKTKTLYSFNCSLTARVKKPRMALLVSEASKEARVPKRKMKTMYSYCAP